MAECAPPHPQNLGSPTLIDDVPVQYRPIQQSEQIDINTDAVHRGVTALCSLTFIYFCLTSGKQFKLLALFHFQRRRFRQIDSGEETLDLFGSEGLTLWSSVCKPMNGQTF